MMFNTSPDKEEPDFYAAVGNKSPIRLNKTRIKFNGKDKEVPISRILEDNNVRVTMGTWIGTNKLGSLDQLTKLAEAGLIDKQTVLEFYNAPNIPRILERIGKEQTQAAMLQAATTSAPGTMPAIEGNTPNATIGANASAPSPGGAGAPAQ